MILTPRGASMLLVTELLRMESLLFFIFKEIWLVMSDSMNEIVDSYIFELLT